MEAPDADAAASNRYEILARLATGGMAELFLARATAPSGEVRHVVLKRVLPSRTEDPHFVTMFLDEARLAIQLDHPNIVRVYDIGQLGSSCFFTMEYVHGENARTILQRVHALRRRTPIGEAITIALGAAAGLDYAHDLTGPDGAPLGIVHRDVSPANIMVGFDGSVKLVDFGVAKATTRSIQTRVGTIKGKIAYLSPEQCVGNSTVDRRSDVFALGIVLYELLAVQRLFRRDSDYATMASIVADEVPPPSAIRPEVPPAIDAVVMRAIAKAPDRRFPTAGVMAGALQHAAVVSGIELSVLGLGRYLRELFGERPEPWVELDSLHELPSVVTVTGESMIALPRDASIAVPGSPPAGTEPDDVAQIEAALIRTVELHLVPKADDDDFLATPAGSGVEVDHTLEDRPTVIDDRVPDDLDGHPLLEDYSVTPTVSNRGVTPPPRLTRPRPAPPPPPRRAAPSPPILPPGYSPSAAPVAGAPGVLPWPFEAPTIADPPTTMRRVDLPRGGRLAGLSLRARLVLVGLGVIALALLVRVAVH